jgi:DNA polymerase
LGGGDLLGLDNMQLNQLKKDIDDLQLLFGDKNLKPIYGAGCIKNPRVMFIFMNPTAKNVSAFDNWKGIRAPWLGTKNVWRIFYTLGIISPDYFRKIQKMKIGDWNIDFANNIYKEIVVKKAYITNLAKCTQIDARPLKNDVFKNYLKIMEKEIIAINPKNIITFGNQVSSIILEKSISVGEYKGGEKEVLKISGKLFNVYPTHYPVGQGMRNMPIAIKRIKAILF